MRKAIRFGGAATAFALIAGCMNMPTPSSQITGSYTSGLRYETYSCQALGAEVDSLARRENSLVIAQDQRYKSSKVQAFWHGYGTGDGIEAAELASVRGEKEAVRRAMEVKGCVSPAAGNTSPVIQITPKMGTK